MRLDKYLKVSRLIKRRTVANDACDACAPSFSAIEPTPFRKAKTLFTQQLYA